MSVATIAPSDDAAASLRHCAAVTRREAGNFYWGIRLLPRPKFEALCAIYAFAREIDDIGDGPLDDARKLAELARSRTRAARRLGQGISDADQLAWLTRVPAGGWVTLFALVAVGAVALGARLLIPWPAHLPALRSLGH